MKLTREKFLHYQKVFYNKVVESPMSAEFKILSVGTGDTLEEFVGEKPTTVSKTFTLPVLYENNIDPYDREKFGLTSGQDVTIYVSPLQLEKVKGDFLIDRRLTQIIFQDKEFIIDKIEYKERIFDTCIALEILLLSKTKE